MSDSERVSSRAASHVEKDVYPVGYILSGRNAFYRVIASGAQFMVVLEYNGLDEPMMKTFSLIKNEWYKWSKTGVGEKVVLKAVALGVPANVPYPVRDFKQIKEAESLIINGTAYLISSDEPTQTIPERWQIPECTVLNLGKALLCIQKVKQKSLSEKSCTAELAENNKTTKLKETDVWFMQKEV